MKRPRTKALGGMACLAALAAAAAFIAIPALGTAPPGSAFFAKLDGAHEPAGPGVNDPDGYGTFSAGFNGTKLCYGLQVFKIGTPAAAHIHQGAVGVNGPVKVTLNKPTTGTAGASSACTTLSSTLASAIKANPGGYYVNVHTGTFSNGAVRGQLFKATAAQDK
jgi:CHRD domain